jgi:ATP-binding protein involved in chromosome partitioning
VDDRDILAALATVKDPELGRSLVDLGMVRDVHAGHEVVRATLALTTSACPLRDRIRSEAEAALRVIAGDRRVEVTITAMAREEREALARSSSSRPAAPGNLFGPGSKTRTIAVASGKGGVGKSTVAVNLAVALAQEGQAVAVIDADVYGPTVPLMLGAPAVPPRAHEGKLVPPERHGIKFVSMGLFLAAGEPVVWRGPMLGRALEQFLADVRWGSPDILLIDLPPGTGDVALTVARAVPAAEILLVTTPQEAAAKVAIKAARMAQMTGHPLLGVVENMAYFLCPSCGEKHYVFGRGGAFEIAHAMQTRLLGRIPLDPDTRQGGDTGIPAALHPETAVGGAFADIARAVLAHRPAPLESIPKVRAGLKSQPVVGAAARSARTDGALHPEEPSEIE